MEQGDAYVLCTDGLYNVLDDAEIARIVTERDATSSCRELVDAANQLGTMDNLTAAVIQMTGRVPDGAPVETPPRGGLLGRLGRLLRSARKA